jgi:alpha-beta hydrolase superfamily lysophospholipase
MAVREEYYFDSSDDEKTKIHAVKWTPDDNNIKGVLQIVHGMQEYILRYDEFASFMADNGFLVTGHDHIGHGQSVSSEKELGIMHSNDPASAMVEDIYTNYCLIKKQYSDKPYFILGHSMGSYLLRRLLCEKNEGLSELKGAIIMGTGTEKDSTIKMGKRIVSILAKIHGWDYKSKFVAGLMFGKPYKQFDITGQDPENSWLSKNVENVKAYYKNPLDNYMFSLNGYRVLLDLTLFDNQKENISRMNKDLPILFASGDMDPVGNLGLGVREAADKFKDAGMKDVTLHLFENDRHEILNETDREKVRNEILAWILSKI